MREKVLSWLGLIAVTLGFGAFLSLGIVTLMSDIGAFIGALQ